MAVKHNVYNPKTGKPELKTFSSEKAYREYRNRPEQKQWQLDVDLKVYGESANKKLKDLEKKGLTKSPAYKQAIHQIHLITGDTEATRFPEHVKGTTEKQRAVQAAYKFGHEYETSTAAGYKRAQKRARAGFNATFDKAGKLSSNQYDIVTEAADVLRDMFSAYVPGSTQLFSGLIDMANNSSFDDEDIRDFALDLQEEIENAPPIAKEYTRHLLSRGIDDFAHGIKPNAKNLIDEVVTREQKRLESMQEKLKKPGEEFPYK